MAAFATMTAAETRCKEQIVAGTWINAHSQRNETGTISVRVQRKMSPTNPDYGGWTVITDDATD